MHQLPGQLLAGSVISLGPLLGQLISRHPGGQHGLLHIAVSRSKEQQEDKPQSTKYNQSLIESHLLFPSSQSKSHVQAQSQCGRGPPKRIVYTVGGANKLASTTAKLKYPRYKDEQTDNVPVLRKLVSSHPPSILAIFQLSKICQAGKGKPVFLCGFNFSD